ncbi:D-glycero-beta-D-manno-heptose 1-phosphate adenylyltransferase [Georgenia sp. TF02-10]|uniref:D-glycero-beta-D-manno-heptose 1-phosphate adenylyltransferase n=1 Tax=Georgenia sp. TF02-10 TaxID=2917725 RepID=UPI001FA70267|nr:D-glycero-beta-D-manno-heptose 1-phosphate adenylyltransferase [Georgenia sp. TF02-10]UNX54910.1 D-glycero-beta-D-manno-heptose 1-phosphate adenylyltransferase [Georgenia sp. TF02-10]
MTGSPASIALAAAVEELGAAAPVVAVVGDLILDGWWTGQARRMTREAPAPVVQLTGRRYAAGGAANTAMNLAALGAQVRLAGLVGDDENGRRLLDILTEGGVDVTGVVVAPGVPTTVKSRVLAADQVLLRVDEEPGQGYPPAALHELAEAALAATAGAAAEVICDYRGDALTGPVHAALTGRERRPPLTVVDGHELAPWAVLHPAVATPNAGEVAGLLGRPLPAGPDRLAAVARLAPEILAATGAGAVVVTLDRDGTVLLTPDAPPHRTRARPAEEKNTTGAGDTFVAALTLAVAGGLPLPAATDLAQAAADVVVAQPGTAVCTSAQLAQRLGGSADGALGEAELLAGLARERAAGRRIVFTNGCFDVLHRGHTRYLEQAKELGDVLVVAVNADSSVRRLKGPGRPINGEGDRAAVLAALACVDYVTVFDTDTPIPLIERIRPDVYAKGGDYTPEMLPEAGAVTAYGGQVRMLDYVPARSTTAVVHRIRAQEPAVAGGEGPA